MANPSFSERLLAFFSSRWTLRGYDTYSREDYDLPGQYWSEASAQRAARRRLRYLERAQPSASSGGQKELGIQDRVFIVRPDKTNYRYLPDNWPGYLRILIYPVQFDPNPSESVERAFTIMSRDAPQFIPDKFIRAIDLGLQSDAKLSELIPQDHPEAVIREYLTAMRDRLKRA